MDHIFVFEGMVIEDYYGNYTEYKIEKEKQKRLKTKRKQKIATKQISKPTTNVQKLNYKEKRVKDNRRKLRV